MTDYLDPGDLPRPHVHELFERATIFLRLQDGAGDPDILDPDDAEFAHALARRVSAGQLELRIAQIALRAHLAVPAHDGPSYDAR